MIEINNYYKEYLTKLPIIFPYSVNIVNVEREGGNGLLIKLEVIAHPFVGSINTVGSDLLTKVDYRNNVGSLGL